MCGDTQDGFAYNMEVAAMGVVVKGDKIEPNTFVEAAKCAMECDQREG